MISVIMPAYNAEKYLAEAIDSILNQSFRNFELIIVNDGSTDNTLAIIQQYAAQDQRISIVKTAHIGTAAARNAGIEAAKSDWIAMMDADDIALPERLEKQIKVAQSQPQVAVWGTYVQHINSKGELLGTLNLWGQTTKEAFYQRRLSGEIDGLAQNTLLFKKSTYFKAGGYNSTFEVGEDIELYDRLAEYGPLLAIPEPLLLYRVHLQSLTMQKIFHMKEVTDYVSARHKARLKGLALPDFASFLSDIKKQPLILRFVRWLQIMSLFYYRKAGLSYAEKAYLREFDLNINWL